MINQGSFILQNYIADVLRIYVYGRIFCRIQSPAIKKIIVCEEVCICNRIKWGLVWSKVFPPMYVAIQDEVISLVSQP